MDNSLFEFLSKLEESSIPYVVWKGSHEIGKCLDRASDLDIFVPEHSQKLVFELAKSNWWIKAKNQS